MSFIEEIGTKGVGYIVCQVKLFKSVWLKKEILYQYIINIIIYIYVISFSILNIALGILFNENFFVDALGIYVEYIPNWEANADICVNIGWYRENVA